MALQYKVASFEGPLDLLLHLIDQAEVDIYNIPIKQITDQYMDYLHSMQQLDLEPTSEFLVMAATLLSIKSQMLLPKPPPLDLELEEDGEDPRAALVRRLIEYRKYRIAAETLREQELARSLIYTREPLDLTAYLPQQVENPVQGLYMTDLMIAFGKVLRRMDKRVQVAHIQRDEISVKDRVLEIAALLRQSATPLRFSTLFTNRRREQIVATFLATLELMKMKQIICYQQSAFADIVLEWVGEEAIGEFETDQIDY